MDDTRLQHLVVLDEPTPRRVGRREALLAAAALVVASIGVIAVAVAPPPPVEVAAGSSPHAPPSSAAPTTVDLSFGTTPADEPPVTTTTMVVTSVPDRPRKKQTLAEYAAEVERENGCIPGTFWTTRSDSGCTKYPSSVDGRVVDTAGRPIPDACVTSWLPPFTALRTDDEGRYSLESGGGIGSHYTYGSCPGSSDPFPWVPVIRPQTLQPEPGEHLTADDVVLQRSGGVRGRVVDLDGRPVEGVCVATRTIDESISRATAADGSFSLTGVVPGTNQIGFDLRLERGCPTVGIWDPNPDVVVRPGEWTEVTLAMQPGRRL